MERTWMYTSSWIRKSTLNDSVRWWQGKKEVSLANKYINLLCLLSVHVTLNLKKRQNINFISTEKYIYNKKITNFNCEMWINPLWELEVIPYFLLANLKEKRCIRLIKMIVKAITRHLKVLKLIFLKRNKCKKS